ncbi:hypothetical protein [Lacrimispora brassicae]
MTTFTTGIHQKSSKLILGMIPNWPEQVNIRIIPLNSRIKRRLPHTNMFIIRICTPISLPLAKTKRYASASNAKQEKAASTSS